MIRSLALALTLCLLLPTVATAQWGEWPENDQRDGQCEFTDWSRFAFVKSVYDADTITVDIDQGFSMMWVNQKIRFFGINAPEIRTKDADEKAKGLEARDWLREVISQKWIVITTHKYKSGKFGRKLATACRNGRDVIVEMIKDGRVIEATY